MKKVDLAAFVQSRTFWLVTLYLVYMCCTLFWADSFEMNDLSKYGRRVLYIIIFVAITIHLTKNDQDYLLKLLPSICWVCALVAIITIAIFYSKHPFPSARLFGYGLLDNPFQASSIYGIIVLICTHLVLHQRSFSMRVVFLGLLVVSFSYMLLAQSRSALLSLIIAMAVWQLFVWFRRQKGSGSQMKGLLIVLAIIFAGSAALFLIFPEFFDLAFLSRPSHYRLKVWGKLLSRIEAAPWFGHGLIADPRTEIAPGRILVKPHSVLMGTLFYGGVIGLLLLIAVVVSTLWQGFRRMEKPIDLLIGSMALYGALCMVLNGNMLIHHPKPFWLFFWFPVALVVASEMPGHHLHGDLKIPNGGEATSPTSALN
jgi:O-antigen ligase